MGWVFFFQAEDGIRDGHVTGVQTCALPISQARLPGLCDFDQESDADLRRSDVPATIALELARVSESPGVRDLGYRLLRGRHMEPEAALRPLLYGAGHQAHRVVWGDREPEPGVGQPAGGKPWLAAPRAGVPSQVPHLCQRQ